MAYILEIAIPLFIIFIENQITVNELSDSSDLKSPAKNTREEPQNLAARDSLTQSRSAFTIVYHS